MDNIGSTFAKTGINATGFSLLGLIFALFAGTAFAGLWGGTMYGGIILLIAGFFDMLDGAVARITGTTSLKGAFIDSNFDRVVEIVVYGGITFGEIGEPGVIVAALAASLMVSYTRAKGESLNIKLSGVGIGERAERIFILAITSIIGYPYYGVMLVFAVASLTYIHRFIYIFRQLEGKL